MLSIIIPISMAPLVSHSCSIPEMHLTQRISTMNLLLLFPNTAPSFLLLLLKSFFQISKVIVVEFFVVCRLLVDPL